MRLPRFSFLVASLGAVVLSRAASFDDRVELLFRPPLGEVLALSPDGQRIAYTSQPEGDLRLVVMSLEPPGPKRTVKIDAGPDAAGSEPSPVRLRFLRWASSSRLVYAPVERVVPLPPVTDKQGRTSPNPDGPTIVSPILLVDVDGRERGTLVDASFFQELPENARRTLADMLRPAQKLAAIRKEPVGWRMPHLDVLGFHPRDRELLILRTHGAYSRPMQHVVDLRTGNVSEFGSEWPAPPGEPHVFDWFRLKTVGERKTAVHPTTEWRDEELGVVQRELNTKFSRRSVELLDWSETRARVVFRVTGGSDPGRIFLWQRMEDLVVELIPRAPWLGASQLSENRFFAFDAPDGARLSGYVTWPRQRPAEPPPLLVMFPSGFPGRAQPAFDPEAQVFADLGFVVARLNHRSVAGVAARDLTALRTGVDRVAVADAQAALEWIAARNPQRPWDHQRIAALGRGFGGYLAVRALQLQPAIFHRGVAIDAPLDLRPWLRPTTVAGAAAPRAGATDIPAPLVDHADADWKKLSVLDQAAALTAPVLLLVEPGRNPVVDAATAELRRRLADLGRPPEYLELDPGFGASRPASRANAYRRVAQFLEVPAPGSGVEAAPAREAGTAP